jgi:glycerol-3-phosphate acyltransferase PlsY
MTLAAVLIPFFIGAIPFSLVLGEMVLGLDVRDWGDGNPGATNAFRAGGWRIGLPALVLDFAKGFSGVALINVLHPPLSRWAWITAAIAPVLGHAFSPFLGGRGGKAVATTFGLWAALTGPYGPCALGCTLLLCLVLARRSADWVKLAAAFTALGVTLAALGVWAELWGLWVLNFALVMFKQWQGYCT